MAIMKFSKGKVLSIVPNGTGDGSAYFNGTSGTTKIKDTVSGIPSGSNPFSFSVWFAKSDESYIADLVTWGIGDYGRNVSLYFQSNRIITIASHGAGLDFAYYEVNKWYHIVITHNGDNYLHYYINGNYGGSWRNPNTFNLSPTEINIGVNYNGFVKDLQFYNRALTQNDVDILFSKGTVADGLVLTVPLQAGKDNDSMFSSKSFVYDESYLTTSSGFNSLGKPIKYRSASLAGVNYSPIDIPKDGLVFYADYKNGKDRVTKTQGECNNVDFVKYKGCNCAYFNGVDSSILWKNILTNDLQHYTIFTKFSALPKDHWGMIFGISPENERTQGYSMKTYGEYLSYTNRGSDEGGASITYDTFYVGTLVGYGEWIEIYLNGTVYLGHSASSIPANSWLYNGIDFGYSDPQPYYGYIAESIVYNRTFSKDELQALTQQLLNKGEV